jgi:hypothetical protein
MEAYTVVRCSGSPHCLENRLIDGGKVVNLTHGPRSILQKRYFSASDTHFC